MDLSDIIVPKDLEFKPLVTCEIEGLLDEGDLRELALSTKLAAEPLADEDDPSDLKKIREKHHSVARMIAGGLSQRMVSQLVKYSESYLSVLLNNPSMQELVELYRMQHGASQQIITEKLKTVGLKAIEKLEEKIDEGGLNNQELLSAAKLGLDRAGHGPQSKSHVVHEEHIFDHAEIARRNEAARQRSAQRIVPAQEVRAALPAPEQSETGSETDRNLDQEGTQLHEDRG